MRVLLDLFKVGSDYKRITSVDALNATVARSRPLVQHFAVLFLGHPWFAIRQRLLRDFLQGRELLYCNCASGSGRLREVALGLFG